MDALNKDEYVGPSEASHILRISGTYMRRLLDEGRVPHVQTPIGRLISRADVERLAIERAAGPHDALGRVSSPRRRRGARTS